MARRALCLFVARRGPLRKEGNQTLSGTTPKKDYTERWRDKTNAQVIGEIGTGGRLACDGGNAGRPPCYGWLFSRRDEELSSPGLVRLPPGGKHRVAA